MSNRQGHRVPKDATSWGALPPVQEQCVSFFGSWVEGGGVFFGPGVHGNYGFTFWPLGGFAFLFIVLKKRLTSGCGAHGR